MSAIDAKLEALCLELTLPPPAANYMLWKQHGGLIYISGRGARDSAGGPVVGRLGADLTTKQAYQHARIAGLLILSIARQAAGSLDRVEALKVFGMVNSVPDYREHSKVIDGCSDILVEILGERGRHARSAVGVSSLPHGLSVEIEATFALLGCDRE